MAVPAFRRQRERRKPDGREPSDGAWCDARVRNTRCYFKHIPRTGDIWLARRTALRGTPTRLIVRWPLANTERCHGRADLSHRATEWANVRIYLHTCGWPACRPRYYTVHSVDLSAADDSVAPVSWERARRQSESSKPHTRWDRGCFRSTHRNTGPHQQPTRSSDRRWFPSNRRAAPP